MTVTGPVTHRDPTTDDLETRADYWCRVLLGQPGYAGAILNADRHVHDIEAFRAEHFDRWYALWIDSIDQRWTGPTADLAKTHAAQIAAVLASPPGPPQFQNP